MTAKVYSKKAKSAMIELELYKPEFDPVIKVYGELMEQHEILTKRFIESDYNIIEMATSGARKAPIISVLETLRKDILSYSSQLGFTPQGLLRAKQGAFDKKTKSGVMGIIKGLDAI